MKVTKVLPEQPLASLGNDTEHQSTDIPAVPVLRSPLPHGLCVHQTSPPTRLPNRSITNSSNSDSVSGRDVITSTAAETCNVMH